MRSHVLPDTQSGNAAVVGDVLGGTPLRCPWHCRVANEHSHRQDQPSSAARYGLDHTFDRRGESWSIHTLYLHLIEEWARHNGHADLIREAIDGATGE